MEDDAISDDLIDRIRVIAGDWARLWGEDAPRNLRLVATTQDAAIKHLHEEGGVGAPLIPVYLVTMEGSFTRRPGAPGAWGVWAAILVFRSPLRLGPYTVRPTGHVPRRPLERLGRTYEVGDGGGPDLRDG
ncbi:hypothetical protein AB0Q95_11830 [Streptomyces sp. NPDC059900]|uniref:hypothetical protein n=1 Tax=Streptomyces sp. NPDC059900 TaxID=3155816 RepID=UPI003439ED27